MRDQEMQTPHIGAGHHPGIDEHLQWRGQSRVERLHVHFEQVVQSSADRRALHRDQAQDFGVACVHLEESHDRQASGVENADRGQLQLQIEFLGDRAEGPVHRRAPQSLLGTEALMDQIVTYAQLPVERGDGGALKAPLGAFNAGVSIASVVVHFVDWPWSRRLGIFPWLDEAEGMGQNLLPPYNTVLWLWGIGGVGAVLTETRRADLRFVAAGLLTGPLLLASARHHFVWAREQANHTSGEDGQWSPAFLDTPDRTESGRPGSALDVPRS